MSGPPPPPPPMDMRKLPFSFGKGDLGLKLPFSDSPPSFDIERVESVRGYSSDMSSPIKLVLESSENGPLVFIISYIHPYDLFDSVIKVCRVFHDLTFFLLNSKSNLVSHLWRDDYTKIFFGAHFQYKKKYVCETLFKKLVTYLEIKSIPMVLSTSIDLLTYCVRRGFNNAIEQIIDEFKDPPQNIMYISDIRRKKRTIQLLLKKYKCCEKLVIPSIFSLLLVMDPGITKHLCEHLKEVHSKIRPSLLIRETLLRKYGELDEEEKKRMNFDVITQVYDQDLSDENHGCFKMSHLAGDYIVFTKCDERTIIQVITYFSKHEKVREMKIGEGTYSDDLIMNLIRSKKLECLEFILQEQLSYLERCKDTNKKQNPFFVVESSSMMFPYIQNKYFSDKSHIEILHRYLSLMSIEANSPCPKKLKSNIFRLNRHGIYEFAETILETRSVSNEPLFEVTQDDLKSIIEPFRTGFKKRCIAHSNELEKAKKLIRIMIPYVSSEIDITDTLNYMNAFFENYRKNNNVKEIRNMFLLEFPTKSVLFDCISSIGSENYKNRKGSTDVFDIFTKSFRENPHLHSDIPLLVREAIVRDCYDIVQFLLDFSQDESFSFNEQVLVVDHFTFETALSVATGDYFDEKEKKENVSWNIFHLLFDNYLKKIDKRLHSRLDKLSLLDACLNTKDCEVIRKCIEFVGDFSNNITRVTESQIKKVLSFYDVLDKTFGESELVRIVKNLLDLYVPDDYSEYRNLFILMVETRNVNVLSLLFHHSNWRESYLLLLNNGGYGRYFDFLQVNISSFFDVDHDEEDEDEIKRKERFGKLDCTICRKQIDLLRDVFGRDYFYCSECTDVSQLNGEVKFENPPGEQNAENNARREEVRRLLDYDLDIVANRNRRRRRDKPLVKKKSDFPVFVRVFCKNCVVVKSKNPSKGVCLECGKGEETNL